MDPITVPLVHNLRVEKEQLRLKLNKNITFRNLCNYSWAAIYRSYQSDFAYTYTLRDGANPSKKLHTKVKMANFIYITQLTEPRNPIQFIIKFPYNARSDWLKQRALSEIRKQVDDI